MLRGSCEHAADQTGSPIPHQHDNATHFHGQQAFDSFDLYLFASQDDLVTRDAPSGRVCATRQGVRRSRRQHLRRRDKGLQRQPQYFGFGYAEVRSKARQLFEFVGVKAERLQTGGNSAFSTDTRQPRK
jgi:hypothetical protein